MALLKAPFWLAGCSILFAIFALWFGSAYTTLLSAPDFVLPWRDVPNGLSEWTRFTLAWGVSIWVSYVTLFFIWAGFKRLTDWTFGETRVEQGGKS